MKPRIIAALLIIGTAIWLLSRTNSELAPDEKTEVIEPVVTPAAPPDPVLADTMLASYASDETSGKQDLSLIVAFLDSVFLLVKNRDTADYATNEDLVIFLQGNNSHQSPFLNPSSNAVNDQGQLIDRWGSPIIVHPVSQKLLEIRLAGPDQKPYTEDDLLWPAPQ